MEKHLKKQVSNHFPEVPFFILGVSGGPDSMALLYLFNKLNLHALVVHINYGTRGRQSDLDQELVEQFAFEWGFECCTVRLHPQEADYNNFQNWARNERYQIFENLKKAHNADAIAVAHHLDDQLETILQKLMRGSAPSAWRGMEEWDGNLFRPLLSFSKEEILGFCEEESVPYRIDESNLESKYARNFLRGEFTDKMNELFPGWQQNILALQEKGELFKSSVNYISKQVLMGDKISIEAFSDLPENLKAAVLKDILDQRGEETEVSKGELNELLKIQEIQTGKSIEVAGFEFVRDRDHIIILKEGEEKDSATNFTFTRKEAAGRVSSDNFEITLEKGRKAEAGLYFDARQVAWPVQVRTWQAGDKFRPLGMSGSQKVSDHLTNKKIAAHLKEKALLFCGSDGTIYAIIYPRENGDGQYGAISEFVKCTDNTEEYLTINFR